MISLVLVDNGDTEPEVWAFEREEDADEFAQARGGEVQTVSVLSAEDARDLIENEKAGL